jgi:chromosomal replication initiation ATPase DnaA
MKKEVFNQYAKRIADMFGITMEQLFSKTRNRDIVDARYLLYYMCSTRPMQLIYIQKFLEENGYVTKHPPLIHGINIVTKRLREDADYRIIVNKLKDSVTI